jgi:hypothetical protein
VPLRFCPVPGSSEVEQRWPGQVGTVTGTGRITWPLLSSATSRQWAVEVGIPILAATWLG